MPSPSHPSPPPSSIGSAQPSPRDVFRAVSVVIPAYNAGRLLRSTLQSTLSWLAASGLDHEIIVVDDGSTDDTSSIARSFDSSVRLIVSAPNRGKGHAVRTGMLAAKHPWRLFMDADNSTTIAHLDRFAAAASAPPNPQVLIASRRLERSRIVRPQHPIRQALGRSFPYLVRALALPDVHDTQCGFKLFSAAAAVAIFPRQRVERFAFDVELLLLAKRLHLPLAEVPVDWDNPTDSTVQIHRDTFRMLYDLLRSVYRMRRGRIPTPLPPRPGH